ncbi:hypothetical protein JXA40_06795 [bacterium]|nr:hypothetical protein [candidate division CSSED10-310 bacterium]
MVLSNVEIVLVEPIYPGNVGSAARSAFNYGVEIMKIVGKLDCSAVETRQMALYGFDLIRNLQRFESLEAAVADTQLVVGMVQQPRSHRQSPGSLNTLARELNNELSRHRIALVFGREDNGLTREEVDLCHYLATIPNPKNLSFNLAHSVTVALYEIYQSLGEKPAENRPARPRNSEYQAVIELMHQTLQELDFFKGNGENSAMTAIKDILYRSRITSSDIPLLKAVLYRIRKITRKS